MNELLETIEDIKTMIPDAKYMALMESLTEVNKSIKRPSPPPARRYIHDVQFYIKVQEDDVVRSKTVCSFHVYDKTIAMRVRSLFNEHVDRGKYGCQIRMHVFHSDCTLPGNVDARIEELLLQQDETDVEYVIGQIVDEDDWCEPFALELLDSDQCIKIRSLNCATILQRFGTTDSENPGVIMYLP